MKIYNIQIENLLINYITLKNFKINNHKDVSRAFNILHYKISCIKSKLENKYTEFTQYSIHKNVQKLHSGNIEQFLNLTKEKHIYFE